MLVVTTVTIVFIFSILFTYLPLNKISEQNKLDSFYIHKLTNQTNNVPIYYENEVSIFQQQFSVIALPLPILSISGKLGQNGWYTSDVEISLYITDNNSGLLQIEYAIYNQEWTTFSEPFTIFAEGQTAIYYRSRDVRGYTGATKFQGIDIDKTPPNGSILINAGSKETFSTLVTLSLSVIDEPSGPTTHPPSGYIWGVPSGPADMRFSNDAILWSMWEPITSNKSWSLEVGAGTKKVYAQFRDNAGLVSEIVTDTINLITNQDSLAPVTKLSLSGKKNSLDTYTSDVVIIFAATDDLSGVNMTEYSFDLNNWIEYTGPFYISTEGRTTIHYRTYDFEGNIETINSQTINIDRNETSNPTDSRLTIYVAITLATITIIATIFIIWRKKRKFLSSKA